MSAWSLAVWIVKKLQKNFDFSKLINNYTFGLNTLNATVNNLNNKITSDELQISSINNQIESTKNQLFSRAVTIVATETNNHEPNTEREYGDGTVWFII